MRRTSRLLVVFGIGLAVVVFILIVAVLGGGGPSGTTGGPGATPTPGPVTVVVAAKDIQLGTAVAADMLSTTTLPATSAVVGSFRDPSQVIGQVARRAILTGAQLSAADFNPNQPLIQLQVPPGKRAVAISVSELTGVGKLINIGDYVDMVVTFDETAIKVVSIPPGATTYAHDDGLRPVTVKAPLLLQGLQVIGTIDSPAAAPAPTPANQPQASAAPAEPTLTGTTKLIILAVTDSQAEAILFARTAGTINLVLRSAADASAPPSTTTGVILKTMFTTYGVLPPYLIKAINVDIPQQP